MNEKMAIRKLIEAGYTDAKIVEVLSAKWFKIFKAIKILINSGIARTEVNSLFSLQRERPEYLSEILREERKKKRELPSFERREKERHVASSSPITSEPPRPLKPLNPFGRDRW